MPITCLTRKSDVFQSEGRRKRRERRGGEGGERIYETRDCRYKNFLSLN